MGLNMVNHVDDKLCNVKHVALRDIIDLHIKVVETRLAAMDHALDLKTGELNNRLKALNELRAEVVKDREQFVKKDSYDIKIKTYDDWIRLIENRITVIETRSVVWTSALGIFFIIIQIFLHFIK